jgi:protein-tyrosine phosphatase
VQLPLESLNNTRDLGGIQTRDGRRIRKGRLYRSGHLFAASPKDLAVLAERVGLVADFRSLSERTEKPDPDFGQEYVHLPIFDVPAASVERDEASFHTVARDPKGATAYMLRTYRSFVTDGFARAQYAKFIRLLTEPRDKAALWHCTAGKDRAGFATILVLELLGADRETIRSDYLATNTYLAEECRLLVSFLGEKYGGLTPEIEEALGLLFGAREVFFDAVYETAAKEYGDMERFLSDGLGITSAERETLRRLYLED